MPVAEACDHTPSHRQLTFAEELDGFNAVRDSRGGGNAMANSMGSSTGPAEEELGHKIVTQGLIALVRNSPVAGRRSPAVHYDP